MEDDTSKIEIRNSKNRIHVLIYINIKNSKIETRYSYTTIVL